MKDHDNTTNVDDQIEADVVETTTEVTPEKDSSRRDFLKTSIVAATGVALATGGFPMIWANKLKDVKLRQFGTGVSNINAISEKVKEDLGFTIEMTALDTDTTAQRVATQPKSFDIADLEYFTIKKVWGSGNLQPFDVSKLDNYDKIVGIFKNGKLTPESTIAQGTAPHTVGYVESMDSKTFAKGETNFYTLVPTIYNADTLGIRPDLVGRPITTWADLLSSDFQGKASTLNISSIGIMDAAMVCEAMGAVQYGDKGNMTKEEIDKTMAVFTEAKKDGQFRAFWKSFDESVNLMSSGEVVIQSMWSPAVTKVRSMGLPCVYQPLKEGYRSWGGGLGLSRNLSGLELEAAYEYINWYLSGWVGGLLMKQGYYSAAPETSKEHMTDDEWGFWFEGKAAQKDIIDPFGNKLESAGAKRDGGSFEDRMGSVVCWNSVMDENRYMVKKWNEFIAS